MKTIMVGDRVRYFEHGPYTVERINVVPPDRSGRFGGVQVCLRDNLGRAVGPYMIETLKKEGRA